MEINKNDFITLSDNIKYLVVSKVNYQNIEYYYLVDIVDNSNIKFVIFENDEVVDVENNEVLDEIFKLMIIDLKENSVPKTVNRAEKTTVRDAMAKILY